LLILILNAWWWPDWGRNMLCGWRIKSIVNCERWSFNLLMFSGVEVEVNLRPTVSRPVRLGVRRPSGTRDQFLYLLEIVFRQLRVCYFVAPSLTRGWMCNLLLLLILASTVPLGSESTGLKTIFYCPNSWDSPNMEGQVPVIISPRNRESQLYPRALCSLSVASYDGGILSSLHTGLSDVVWSLKYLTMIKLRRMRWGRYVARTYVSSGKHVWRRNDRWGGQCGQYRVWPGNLVRFHSIESRSALGPTLPPVHSIPRGVSSWYRGQSVKLITSILSTNN
jgi:hypothetical protein